MKDVPSHHDFFDQAYVKRWAERAIRERPERGLFFDAFVRETLKIPKKEISVLEFGSGPGFLAEQLLDRCAISKYCLFDISSLMHELSRDRRARFSEKTVFLEGDFRKENWSYNLPRNFDLVVSLQSVHELRHARYISRLYGEVYSLLVPGGLFLVCDHVNERRSGPAHFMTVAEHLSTLNTIGFTEVSEALSEADMSLIKGKKRQRAGGGTDNYGREVSL